MPSVITHLYPADQQVEDAQYYRRLLHELIDMGVGLARAVRQQATSQDGAADPAAAAAFDRISRAVRRTIALARKIAEAPPPRADAGQSRVAARRRILREVEDVIQRTVGGADAGALQAELCERLDAPELEDELDGRPVAEIIAEICRDLGIAARDLGILSPSGHLPWKRRTPRDIEVLCARAAQLCATPGSGEAGADPPSLPLDAGADLLQFTPPVRGP